MYATGDIPVRVWSIPGLIFLKRLTDRPCNEDDIEVTLLFRRGRAGQCGIGEGLP